jgi:hypothetical protein
MVAEGVSTSPPATVVIDVAAVADQPVAQSALYDAMEDQARPVWLAATDADGNPSTFTYTAPTAGTLTGTGDELTYTPPPNYSGIVTFTFTASDDAGSSIATITIEVHAVNDAPTAAGFQIAATEDTPAAFTYLGNVGDASAVPAIRDAMKV